MSRSSELTVRTSYMLLAVLLVYSSSVGCEKRIWKNSLDSPDQLGLAVVDALNRKDIEHLNRLRVQRDEFLNWDLARIPCEPSAK